MDVLLVGLIVADWEGAVPVAGVNVGEFGRGKLVEVVGC